MLRMVEKCPNTLGSVVLEVNCAKCSSALAKLHFPKMQSLTVFFLGNAAVRYFCAILVVLVDGGPLLYVHTCLSACP